MAEEWMVGLLMLVVFATGFVLLLNIPGYMGFNLGLGFGDIHNVVTFITVIGVKLVGLVMIILAVFVSWNIVKG